MAIRPLLLDLKAAVLAGWIIPAQYGESRPDVQALRRPADTPLTLSIVCEVMPW